MIKIKIFYEVGDKDLFFHIRYSDEKYGAIKNRNRTRLIIIPIKELMINGK